MAVSQRLVAVGYGVTANITASHAVARGSIPRIRNLFYTHCVERVLLVDTSFWDSCLVSLDGAKVATREVAVGLKGITGGPCTRGPQLSPFANKISR